MTDTVLGTGKMAFKKKKTSSGSLHRGESKHKHIMSDGDECYEER